MEKARQDERDAGSNKERKRLGQWMKEKRGRNEEHEENKDGKEFLGGRQGARKREGKRN